MLKLVKAQGQGIVSDGGRWGHQHQGVPLGGVLDDFSFQVGNLALGNPANSACLELMGRFDFVCASACTVFLANRGAVGLLNGQPVSSGRVLVLQEGDVLRLQPPRLGFWNLLCMQGGVQVPLVLGSRSTCLAAGFGGLQGRALSVGDEILPGPECAASLSPECCLAMPLAWPVDGQELSMPVLPGPELDELTDESRHHFISQPFRLGLQSSRMGYRLEQDEAHRLNLARPLGLNSHAVHPGIVQLPPSGQPVVLLSEAQVTGGYPRIASIPASALWKLAQLGTGQLVHWQLLDEQGASLLLKQRERELMKYMAAIETNRSATHVD